MCECADGKCGVRRGEESGRGRSRRATPQKTPPPLVKSPLLPSRHSEPHRHRHSVRAYACALAARGASPPAPSRGYSEPQRARRQAQGNDSGDKNATIRLYHLIIYHYYYDLNFFMIMIIITLSLQSDFSSAFRGGARRRRIRQRPGGGAGPVATLQTRAGRTSDSFISVVFPSRR